MADFVSYLVSENIHKTIIAAMIANQVNVITMGFLNAFFVPLLDVDFNNDGKSDFDQIEKMKINIFGYKFKIGKFVVLTSKALIILYLVYLFTEKHKNMKLSLLRDLIN